MLNLISRMNARILYWLARLLYRSQVAHSEQMKQALTSQESMSSYRSEELNKVLKALSQFDVSLQDKVLIDLGCNDGSISHRYLEAGAGEVIGVDIDADAVRRANEIHSGPDIRFVQGEVRRIPIDENVADVIVSYDVFEHVADPPPIIAECHRILKPGGKVLIGTWGWYHPFAPHLWAVMPVPWAHVFFSERTLLRACRLVYESKWYQPNMHDFDEQGQRKEKYCEDSISTDYLNKFFISDFRRVFRESPFDAQFHLVPFGSRLARWTRMFLRIPYLREFVTGYLWIVCTKPEGEVSPAPKPEVATAAS